MATRFFLAGAGTGAHWNAGDAAILSAMLQQLREIAPGAEVHVASGNPPGSLDRYGVTEVRFDDIGALASTARTADMLLLGGGGLFFDYWGFPDHVLTPQHGGLSFYAGFALLATMYGKPLAVYGAGVGPLRSEEGRSFTAATFEQADVIAVRDRESQSLLVDLGIEPQRIRVTNDPAYVLTPAPATRAAEIMGSLTPPILGVAIRDWNIGVDPDAWQSELARSLDHFAGRHGGTVLFLPFHKTVGDVNDVDVAQRVAGRMQFRDRTHVLSPEHTPEEISAIVGRCDALIGMRLHSIIFARTHGVPFVAISYDPKVRGAADGAMSKFSLALPDLSSGRLDALVEEMWSRREALRDVMMEERAACSAGAAENAAAVLELLQKRAAPKVPGPQTAALLAKALSGQLARTAEFEQTIARMRDEAEQRQEAIEWLKGEVRVRDAEIGALRTVRS